MAEQSTDFRCAQLSLARLDERMIESGSERHVPRSVDIHILPAQMYQYFVFMVDICHGLQIYYRIWEASSHYSHTSAWC
jgi:hypothetical protein